MNENKLNTEHEEKLNRGQRNTIFIVKNIIEIVANKSFKNSEMQEIDCIGDIFYMLYSNSPEETLGLLKDILNLPEYIETNYTLEDLEETDEWGAEFLLDDSLHIAVIKDAPPIPKLQQIAEKASDDIVEYLVSTESAIKSKIEKLGRNDLREVVKSIINNETVQNMANLANALGSIASVIGLLIQVSAIITPYIINLASTFC